MDHAILLALNYSGINIVLFMLKVWNELMRRLFMQIKYYLDEWFLTLFLTGTIFQRILQAKLIKAKLSYMCSGYMDSSAADQNSGVQGLDSRPEFIFEWAMIICAVMTFRMCSTGIWRHMKVLIDPLDEADEIFSESDSFCFLKRLFILIKLISLLNNRVFLRHGNAKLKLFR